MSKKKSTATFLALIGGALGLHKFYLGKTTAGVFYIFLSYMLLGMFRLPVTVILGIIDALKLMGMSQERFDQKYNSGKKRRRGRDRYQTRHQTKKSENHTPKQTERYRYDKSQKRSRKNPFKISADKKYEDFDLEEALVDYEQALLISPDDTIIHFKMASVYSLLENKNKSFYHLDKSIELGFDKADKILEIDDFAYLRIQDEFDAFKESGFRLSQKKNIEAPNEDLQMDDLLLSQLNKLKTLREKGLLSEKEFLYEKEKLLNK